MPLSLFTNNNAHDGYFPGHFFLNSKLGSHYSSNVVADISFLEAKRPLVTLHNSRDLYIGTLLRKKSPFDNDRSLSPDHPHKSQSPVTTFAIPLFKGVQNTLKY